MASTPSVSMIVPTYNEQDTIAQHLRYHQSRFEPDEIIVVDGGSGDETVGEASSVDGPVKVLVTDEPGRGLQLKRGAESARGDWIMMIHADTRLPKTLDLSEITGQDRRWGWFDVRLDDSRLIFRMVSMAISIRSALFSTPTGDQAIWVHRDLLDEIGGVPDVPIMEDVSLVKQLRTREAGRRLNRTVVTSARKWQEEGVLTVILLMWWFRLAHIFGASHEWIYRQYYGTDSQSS